MTNIILAADIGGTTCKLGIFDIQPEQLHKWSIHTDTSDHTGELLLKTFMILLFKKYKSLISILKMFRCRNWCTWTC